MCSLFVCMISKENNNHDNIHGKEGKKRYIPIFLINSCFQRHAYVYNIYKIKSVVVLLLNNVNQILVHVLYCTYHNNRNGMIFVYFFPPHFLHFVFIFYHRFMFTSFWLLCLLIEVRSHFNWCFIVLCVFLYCHVTLLYQVRLKTCVF